MSTEQEIRDQTIERAQAALAKLRGLDADDAIDEAKPLVELLRNFREYNLMGELAEALSRADPADAKNRRLYAQFLIESRMPTVAIDVLQVLSSRLAKDDPEFDEAMGLLGRANKQIYADAVDKSSDPARRALDAAVAAYRAPFDANPDKTWHGVNLLALLALGRKMGLRLAPDLKMTEVAKRLVKALEEAPEAKRDEWYLPSLAEASLGLNDWDTVERNVKAYVAASSTQAFQVASTLRQFTQIWGLDDHNAPQRGRDLLNILRARLLQLPGGELELRRGDVQRLRADVPSDEQLEAVLGPNGVQTFKWWRTGLGRALSVAAIRHRLGNRVGTGFLVKAVDLGLAADEGLVVITNFHVVNEHGASDGIRPEEAEVLFEEAEGDHRHTVEKILWTSPPDQHDATVLRVTPAVTGVEPLPVARNLPALETTARVYVIGHAGGRDLAFSFQDNALVDHEGSPLGKPQIPGVCRVHYGAPTERGNSGSPVFNGNLWEVIALHHKGGKLGMPKLNGAPGTYGTNEGISLQCIAAAIANK